MIGRSPYCSIVLSNSRASRQHCAITWDETGLSLADLGSSNGTYLNGTRLAALAKLQAGDVLSVGTDMLEVIEVKRKASDGITRTEQGPVSSVEAYDFDEAQSTKRQEMTLDVIEAIASSASEDGLSNRIAASVRGAVDLFLNGLLESGRRLSSSEAARLAAVAELVGARDPSGGHMEWKHRTIERIARDSVREDSI